MHRLRDETLQSIAERSRTFGPAARRILDKRISGVERDTAKLTDLTERIQADNATVRPLLAAGDDQQPGASSEDHALAELRRLYG